MKAYRKVLLILVTICLLLSMVVRFEIPDVNSFLNEFYSGDLLTISMFDYAKYSLRQGDIFDGLKFLYLASIRAVEFGKRQRAARPLVEEYYRLYRQGDYKNALIVCEKAEKFLGQYDDRAAMYYECVKTREQLRRQAEDQ